MNMLALLFYMLYPVMCFIYRLLPPPPPPHTHTHNGNPHRSEYMYKVLIKAQQQLLLQYHPTYLALPDLMVKFTSLSLSFI